MMMNAEQALTCLRQGNERFASGLRTYPNQDRQRIQEVASGQNPHTTILCCSDSRVPPEHIFDAGLGELFVVRVAGNVVGEISFGAIEYGILQCKTPLLLVLGHTNCGAIQAAVQGADAPGHIENLVDKVAPAVETARRENTGMDNNELVNAAVNTNVLKSMDNLTHQSSIIKELVQNGSLTISGGIYHLESGEVEWLELED